ncbi:MAG TPA: EF-hand domain-containing protein [Verrucomicrobiae bacterium]|nr:EF-hand domain-containing protein [Verrucomicrobiae bacterium]
MKKQIILTALLGTSAITILAQDADTGAPAGRPPGHRPPPIIAALDANKDGIIDATELANATAALTTLDKNGDGKLTRDELMGERGEGQGPRGPGGPGAGRRGPRPAPPQQ